MAIDLSDRFQGCFWGGAIGDAGGAQVEILSQQTIREKTGNPQGWAEFPPIGDTVLNVERPAGSVTDDTSMSVMTLVSGALRAPTQNPPRAFLYRCWQSYVLWGSRQEGGEDIASFIDTALEWPRDLMEPFLETGGAGRGTLAALMEGRMGTLDAPLSYDRTLRGKQAIGPNTGCGGQMRIWPLAFMTQPADVYPLACAVAATTHGAPVAYSSAGVIAQWIADAARSETLSEALTEPADPALRATFTASCSAAEVSPFHRDAAIDALPSIVDPSSLFSARTVFAQVAYVLSSAAPLLPTPDNFKKTIRLAVNISGDSDSVAAIVGNVLGAAWGMRAIPKDWQDRIVQKAEIARVIDWAKPRLGLA